MKNPFSLVFGKEPQMLINTYEQYNLIKDTILDENPVSNTYLITGVRGSGKTVLLTRIEKYFDSIEDFIVIDINPEIDILEYLASSIYEKSNSKFKFLKTEFSFSFKGVSISLSGEKPVSNVITLLDKLLTTIKKNNKKVLICIDDVVSNTYVKVFVQQFQIMLRKDYPVFLLMTGLYENVRNLQNEKSLTFLYRAPKIQINTLSLISIAESYEKELNVEKNDAIKMSKLTSGYAFAYQVLGYILFEREKRVVDYNVLKQFDTYLREYVYEKVYFDLSETERKILRALATDNDNKVSNIIDDIGISRESMSQYRDKLIKKGLLNKVGWGKLDFALPRFREYVLVQSEFEI